MTLFAFIHLWFYLCVSFQYVYLYIVDLSR